MKSLKQKSISGVAWALIEKFGAAGVKLILGIVLARLLTPEDFGLIGMITVFFVIAEVFVDSGFAMAYVQKKEVSDIDADTVFYTNLIISILLFILLFLCAPLIADFYKQPRLVMLTRIMAVVIIINAFNVIQRAKLMRSVNFKQLSRITLTSSVLSGAIGILAALKEMGVWALVLQNISNRTFIMIGFWYASDYRPERRFSKQSFSSMFSFGSWMLISNIIRTFFDNIYLLTIGKFYPVAQLGFYSKAKQIVSLSSNNIAQAVGSVAFPVYASLQDDKKRIQNAMHGFITQTMFFIVPLLTVLIVVARPLILLLLTEKWEPMIPYFQLICFTAILYPLNQINAQSLIALGKSKLAFNVEMIRNLLRLLNIFITYRYGIVYMILGEILISIIFFFVNSRLNQKYTNYGVLRQIQDVWKLLFGGIIAAVSALALIVFIDKLVFRLLAGTIIICTVYLVIEYFINREVIQSSVDILRNFKERKD